MRVLSPICGVLVLCFLLRTAQANNINTGGQAGLVRCHSAHTLGRSGYNIGGGLKYGHEYDYVEGPYGTGPVTDLSTGEAVGRESGKMFSGNLYAALGLARWVDLSVDFPLYWDFPGWADENRYGRGDLGAALKWRFPFQERDEFVNEAYMLRLGFPTGSKDRGYFPRHAYYLSADNDDPGKNPFTAASITINPMLMWTFNFNFLKRSVPLRAHFNLGGVATTMSRRSTAAVAAVAFEFFPTEVLTLFAEFSGEARFKYYTEDFKITHFKRDPIWLSPGMRLDFPNGMYTVLSGDVGLSSRQSKYRTTWNRYGYAYSTAPNPRYGVQLSIGWDGIVREPDTDFDGIPDKQDQCRDKPEDMDSFEDDDGCPDTDNDNDGLPDGRDECPNDSAFCDGCPVHDSDGDKIPDDNDKCPNRAEDFDGFQDDDGCPEADNENDGIADSSDKCPNQAEDFDGFEDEDGCPDPDNDGDKVPDESDRCPNHFGLADNEGCPKAEEIKGQLILDGVSFESGKASLTPNSYTVLDRVVESLKEWTDVELEIRGYTDSYGSYEYNKRLSQNRAMTVMDYLVDKGIDRSRLHAVGYGEDDPIADNRTAEGREKNRRVELHRVD